MRAIDDERPQASNLHERPGYNRICHLGGRSRSHSNPGHHGVPSETAGALERHRRRDKRVVATRLVGREGQSTVEFAVVMAGFLSLTVALSAVWHAFDGGLFVQQALTVASHHIQSVAPVTITDLFLY